MLYELLAGRAAVRAGRPHAGRGRIAIARSTQARTALGRGARGRGRPGGRAARRRRRDAWADLDVLCLTAMHQDPARRYRTVEALDPRHRPLPARASRSRRGPTRWAIARASSSGATGALSRRTRRLRARRWELVVFYTVRLTVARNAAAGRGGAHASASRRFMLQLFQGGRRRGAGPSDSLRVVTLVDRGVREARSARRRAGRPGRALRRPSAASTRSSASSTRADTLLAGRARLRRAVLGEARRSGGQPVALALPAARPGANTTTPSSWPPRPGDGPSPAARGRSAGVARATTALGQVLEAAARTTARSRRSRRRRASESARGTPAPSWPRAWRSSRTSSSTRAPRGLRLAQPARPRRWTAGCTATAIRIVSERPHQPRRHPAGAGTLRRRRAASTGEALDDQPRLVRGRTLRDRGHTHHARAHPAVHGKRLRGGRGHAARGARRSASASTGPMHPAVASTLNELGRLAQQEGRLDEAERDFRRMLRSTAWPMATGTT